MNKVVAFTIADTNNLKYYEMFKNSLRKFHNEKELPLVLVGPEELKAMQDPDKFYRMTPFIGRRLIREAETVIKFDCDSVVTGDLSHLWEGEFDAGVVNNSNPREYKAYPVSVLDIHPFAYVNCGLVVMKSREFVDHWWDLCTSPHFYNYQMREQDLLNIIVFYGNYKINFLDKSNKFHGLASKGYWPQIELRDKRLILPGNAEWNKEDKEIVVIHWAGGQINKMNFDLYFAPNVVEKLNSLCASS